MTGTLDEAVLAIMRKAADEAILPRYQQLALHEIEEKATSDFVTVADRDAELILAEGLAALIPDAKIVGEEAAHADPSIMTRLNQFCWIIDPVDGTYNFAHGRPPFGIIVALADGGEAQAGWIYDVLSGRFCHCHRGHGSFIDGERVRARATGEMPPVAAISLAFMDEVRRKAITTHVAPHYRLVDIPLCAAEQYPRLALGQNDLSLFERTLPWDHAAGALWLNEAGGKAGRPDGTPYRVDDHARLGLVAATSPRLWQELVTRLNAL